ncbi:hypothetical protein [Streptococcus suis]|uniref:hypothetical protein n=1 Tax=Streptococcus suis TaxID=1307 RepID=UPI000CF5B0DA|nr:hypothetical protein [Streptococcus suis]NQI44885.1 hypothetical protein [Streptococcus suis]NQJ75433.1 hypothetical protein [Streptococcus suis]NQJ79572.1 hypothetical protein [Streptococcus suis]NQK10968.1 hypothetical protein [Streptococcus suis]HEL1653930.1 hypothetical protein [Streptococcus suis]
MIENDYLEQAGKDRLELEQHRLNYMADDTPTQAQRLAFFNYLEQQYENTLKKMVASTDKQALGELLDLLELPAEIESQFIRDMAISGLLAKG